MRRFILAVASVALSVCCASAGAVTPDTIATTVSAWPSSGHDLADTHSNPSETMLGTGNVGNLRPRWSVDFASYLAATPAVVAGRAYLADRSGKLTAVDTSNGALVWSHAVSSYTGITGDVGRATPAVADGRLIFGDQPGSAAHDGTHVIAVNASSGALLWKTVVDTTPTAKITSAATVDGNVVYVGVSSNDEGSAGCCHFRGSVVALNATTGAILWKTYTVPSGYTGGAVWGSNAVVDHVTGLLYVGTGNNYSVPAGVCSVPAQTGCTTPASNDYVDSLVALNLSTGKPTWALRTLSGDVSTNVCRNTAACGPDWDFGAAPNEFTTTIAGVSRRLVGIGQKSGVYWAVDAATGKLVWQTRVGPGGSTGGIQWGTATDGARIYVAVTNSEKAAYKLINGTSTTGGAWSALDPATGRILWQTADPQGVGDFGFVTTANGVVYAGSGAGSGNTMYALKASTGSILWRYASGGSVMGGAAVVDGSVYWASGYYTRYCPSGTTCGTTYRLYAFGTAPSTPTSVGVSQTAAASATIWWQPPNTTGASAITGYRVTRDGVDSSGAGAYATTVSASTRSFTMTKLIAGHGYTITVQAINSAGTGPAAAGTVTMSALALASAPRAVVVTQTGTSQATISWQPPTSAGGGTTTGYRVSRDGVDNQNTGAYSALVASTVRSFTMTRLLVGHTYVLTVQAVTTVGTGPSSGGSVTMAT